MEVGTRQNQWFGFHVSGTTLEEKKVDFDVEEESEVEELTPRAWEGEAVNTNTFLFKLSQTVQRIDAYKEHVGLNKGERKMKMQGVLSKDCKIDV